MARTDADFTAAALEKIMLQNGSVVLYAFEFQMAHGGTNFGFYNGANTGADESDYKPDLTSYDYDAPITESGDVDNAKFKGIILLWLAEYTWIRRIVYGHGPSFGVKREAAFSIAAAYIHGNSTSVYEYCGLQYNYSFKQSILSEIDAHVDGHCNLIATILGNWKKTGTVSFGWLLFIAENMTIRRVVGKFSSVTLPSVPPNNKKTGYGSIQLKRTAFLFDLLDEIDPLHIVEAESPTAMEYLNEMFGFVLYVSEYAAKTGGSKLVIPKVHDRAQVFISCSPEVNGWQVSYVGTIERWSNQAINLPNVKCVSSTSLFILVTDCPHAFSISSLKFYAICQLVIFTHLTNAPYEVENMGRVNYGPYIFDRKGILSSVYVDGSVLKRWKMISIPFHNLNEVPKFNPVIQVASKFHEVSAGKNLEHKSVGVEGPSFYTGHFSIDTKTEVTDTYISLRGWGKGIAFVNEFNIGRYWPTSGPQCNLYIPAPILRQGENVLVIFELESPNPELMVDSVDQPDFTCGPGQVSVHQNEDGKASASLLTSNPLGLRTF
ncbi:Beta-galactosidase 17-like protein [Gossypium australe]|uniref:beta-galactosidase n=1 Tax=Gossypium australe TaxID=47621 RepID=A0A5B6X513_9ROSI|nr:Beta-galactosidase 17-like protein [Gossypium australe]